MSIYASVQIITTPFFENTSRGVDDQFLEGALSLLRVELRECREVAVDILRQLEVHRFFAHSQTSSVFSSTCPDSRRGSSKSRVRRRFWIWSTSRQQSSVIGSAVLAHFVCTALLGSTNWNRLKSFKTIRGIAAPVA